MQGALAFDVAIDGVTYDSIDAAFDKLARGVERIASDAMPEIGRDLLVSLRRVAQTLNDKHGSSWAPGGSGDTLYRRSGAAMAEMLASASVVVGAHLVTGSLTVPGTLAVHEDGAIIRPKSGKFLAVPLPSALDGNGIPLQDSPRAWQSTFVQRSKAGNLIVFQKSASGATPLYVLKESVTIRPRLGFEGAMDTELSWFAERAADQLIARFGEI